MKAMTGANETNLRDTPVLHVGTSTVRPDGVSKSQKRKQRLQKTAVLKSKVASSHLGGLLWYPPPVPVEDSQKFEDLGWEGVSMRLFSLESKLDLLLNSFCFQDVSNNLEGPKTGFDEAAIVKEGVPAFILEMQCKAVRTLQSFWKGLNAKSCKSGTGAVSKASPQAAAAAASAKLPLQADKAHQPGTADAVVTQNTHYFDELRIACQSTEFAYQFSQLLVTSLTEDQDDNTNTAVGNADSANNYKYQAISIFVEDSVATFTDDLNAKMRVGCLEMINDSFGKGCSAEAISKQFMEICSPFVVRAAANVAAKVHTRWPDFYDTTDIEMRMMTRQQDIILDWISEGLSAL